MWHICYEGDFLSSIILHFITKKIFGQIYGVCRWSHQTSESKPILPFLLQFIKNIIDGDFDSLTSINLEEFRNDVGLTIIHAASK